MDMKEKLVELLDEASEHLVNNCWFKECDSCTYTEKGDACGMHIKADYLIANGIGFVTDNNVGSKWTPVTERLPEEDGKYLVFEQSNGRTNTSVLRFAKDARKVDKYDFNGRWKNAWYEYDSEWGYYTIDDVTHWMPLPEPPKGERL